MYGIISRLLPYPYSLHLNISPWRSLKLRRFHSFLLLLSVSESCEYKDILIHSDEPAALEFNYCDFFSPEFQPLVEHCRMQFHFLKGGS